jgi:hypothetical protein
LGRHSPNGGNFASEIRRLDFFGIFSFQRLTCDKSELIGGHRRT